MRTACADCAQPSIHQHKQQHAPAHQNTSPCPPPNQRLVLPGRLALFDAITALVAWVEKGVAPEALLASVRGTGNAGGVHADLPTDWAADRSQPQPTAVP